MSVRGTSRLSTFKLPAGPKPPKLTEPTIKGPGVPKLKAPGVQKIPTLESLSVRARRGLTPKVALAKAAAGASSTSGKRNPNYPTP